MVLAVVVVVALVGVVVWFSYRQAGAADREQVLDLPMICANCRYVFSVSFDGLADLAAQAHAKGFTSAGRGVESPMGLCPRCGKLTVYRADEDPRTGEPVPPAFALTPPAEAKGPASDAESRLTREGD